MRVGTVAVLLAAGGSTRMGSPKQLILQGGKTLIAGTTEKLLAAGAEQVIVVLGAIHAGIPDMLENLAVKIVLNPDWVEGISSSIRIGVRLAAESGASHILLALVDQPYVNRQHYESLLAASGAFPMKIVAAAYARTTGAPAIFPAHCFERLCQLSGDRGANGFIKQQSSDLIPVNMPEAEWDWDTPEDIVR